MLPKRRRSSSLGRRSSNAQRVRLHRINASESLEQRENRLQAHAARMALTRGNETEEESRIGRAADAA